MNEKEAIGKLNEYLFSDYSYLSARTDYARGFKEGAGRVREIVSGILEDCGLLQAPRPMERYMQSLRKEGDLWSGDFDLLPDDVGRMFSKYERLEEEYNSMLSSGVRIPPDERKELEEDLKEARKKFSASLEEAAATYRESVKGTEEREKEEYSRYKLPDGVTKDNLAVDIAADAEEGRGTVRAFFSADGYKDSTAAALSPGDFKAVWEEGKATPEQMAAKYLGAEIREMRDLSRGEITTVEGDRFKIRAKYSSLPSKAPSSMEVCATGGESEAVVYSRPYDRKRSFPENVRSAAAAFKELWRAAVTSAKAEWEKFKEDMRKPWPEYWRDRKAEVVAELAKKSMREGTSARMPSEGRGEKAQKAASSAPRRRHNGMGM